MPFLCFDKKKGTSAKERNFNYNYSTINCFQLIKQGLNHRQSAGNLTTLSIGTHARFKNLKLLNQEG